MSTPITDALWNQTKGIKEYHAKLEETAKRLELDRAALMVALEKIASFVESDSPKTAECIREVIAAARANFPTP